MDCRALFGCICFANLLGLSWRLPNRDSMGSFLPLVDPLLVVVWAIRFEVVEKRKSKLTRLTPIREDEGMSDFWENNAANWNQVVEQKLIESRTVTNPAILQCLFASQPRSILDVGCGEGWISKACSEKNIRYLGIDGSAPLVEMARKKYQSEFQVASYEDISIGRWVSPEKFDAIVFNFSLMGENLSNLLQKVSEGLSEQGRIWIQTLHPLNLSPYEDGWHREDFKAMKIPFDGTMPWFGRTLESWSQVFQQSHLAIQKIQEPRKDEKLLSIIFELKPML